MAMFERFSWESESDVSQVASQDAWELEDARPDGSGDVGGFFFPCYETAWKPWWM
jgi:hypothetical protein